MRRNPWEAGVFIDGGLGTSGEEDDHFLNAGVRLGKVLTGAALPGVLRGQFEYAVSFMPYWQAFTPKETTLITNGYLFPLSPFAVETTTLKTGGSYHGVSITPIILRWNLVHWRRVMPWLQGAGGVIWTNHKFPPNWTRGTSVFNFTPQFGVGTYYFLNSRHAISFGANAVHISNASLGDANPGVNATVQFQIGYTWWK